MIEYVSGKFKKIEIFTNGTLFNDEWISEFKKHKISIAISIHSYKPEMHDFVTQVKGSFERAKKGIEKLKENGIPYRVANILINGVELGECNTDLFRLDKERDVVRMSGRGSNLGLLNHNLLCKRMITKHSRPITRRQT